MRPSCRHSSTFIPALSRRFSRSFLLPFFSVISLAVFLGHFSVNFCHRMIIPALSCDPPAIISTPFRDDFVIISRIIRGVCCCAKRFGLDVWGTGASGGGRTACLPAANRRIGLILCPTLTAHKMRNGIAFGDRSIVVLRGSGWSIEPGGWRVWMDGSACTCTIPARLDVGSIGSLVSPLDYWVAISAIRLFPSADVLRRGR